MKVWRSRFANGAEWNGTRDRSYQIIKHFFTPKFTVNGSEWF
ncbi:hypothetical protein [Nostoc sp. UHCC 0252]|nr:hypothetical protein [Nostoc sp. UHCC 0252]MEA5604168.1 hypothetical protein [Nostoc sp. UHCC 0252]